MHTHRLVSAALCALAFAFAGDSARGAAAVPVSIPFAFMAGASPVGCGQPIANLGTTKSTATLTDSRFYVSNPRLIDASGREAPVTLAADGLWQHGAVALLDFENATGD